MDVIRNAVEEDGTADGPIHPVIVGLIIFLVKIVTVPDKTIDAYPAKRFPSEECGKLE